MGLPVTRLWHVDDNGRRRLYATIQAGSQFFGFQAPKNLHLLEQRVKCAEILRDGWINQGGITQGTWVIEHGVSEGIKFSKMTEELLA